MVDPGSSLQTFLPGFPQLPVHHILSLQILYCFCLKLKFSLKKKVKSCCTVDNVAVSRDIYISVNLLQWLFSPLLHIFMTCEINSSVLLYFFANVVDPIFACKTIIKDDLEHIANLRCLEPNPWKVSRCCRKCLQQLRWHLKLLDKSWKSKREIQPHHGSILLQEKIENKGRFLVHGIK